MADPSSSKPQGIARLFFQEIKPGDVLKTQAKSNISATGGGARDLRIPYDKFAGVLDKMFPQRREEKASSRRATATIILRVGQIHWKDQGKERSTEVEWWPPTEARPREGRLARIHEVDPLLDVPSFDDGRVVLLLVQDDENKLWARYVTEKDLNDDRFNQQVAQFIRGCIADTRTQRSARGWIDYMSKEFYCHG